VNNLIIVESENDKYFIESFIEYLNLKNIEVDNPICNVLEFNCLGGLNNLKNKLRDIRFDDYDKIGIILDADDVGIEGRIDFINQALKEVCSDVNLTEINKFEYSKELDVEIACYITNVNGKGELETLLRKVKSKESVYADCLESWKECLEKNGKPLNQKEFDKIWVSYYLKFDTCIGRDKKQKFKKCANELKQNPKNQYEIETNLQSNEYTIKKDIWDFEHNCLSDLKKFLSLFKSLSQTIV